MHQVALLLVPALVHAFVSPLVALLFSPDPVVPSGSWPLRPQPSVVSGFDQPDSLWGAGHRGVDLLGRPGQSVHAAASGRVSYAGTLAGRGVLVVDHGATRTTYEPVAAAAAAGVRVGAAVGRGQRLGSLQLGGSHCFPRACLHWGLIRNADDTYLDPLLLVGLGPVRLLPLWRDQSPAVREPWRSPVDLLFGWTGDSRGAGSARRGDGPAGRPGAAGRW